MPKEPKKTDPTQPREIKTLKAEQQVCSARFTPCGKFLVAGCFDGLIRRWDAATDDFAELEPVAGHGGWVQAIVFRAEGELLYSVDSWGLLCCWNYGAAKPQATWKVAAAHDGWIRSVAVSPDGKLVATGGADRKLRLWGADDGKKVKEIDAGADLFCVLFHPDGKSVVTGDFKGFVTQWDVETGDRVRQFDATVLNKLNRLQDIGGVRCLTFDTAGTTLFCGGTKPENGGNVQGVPTLLAFDWSTGNATKTLALGNNGDVYACDAVFHPQGYLLIVTSGNPGTGKLLFQRIAEDAPFIDIKKPNCHSIALHPAGQRIAVVTTNANSNGNGRRIGKADEYPGNFSPIFVFDLPV